MRRLGFWVLPFVTGVAIVVLLYLNQNSNLETGSIHKQDAIIKGTNSRRIERNIEEETRTLATTKPKVNSESFNEEDYPHVDPTPSSKASIKHGPIEHGTPLMPFIPQPVPSPPPTSSKNEPVDGSGSEPVSANQPAPCPPNI
ncbi:hypothetical protein LUZ60_005936 [Juncus effusus]|nr:hypothetical protein LUZ60_005936 [Juncus effusus]